MNGQIDGDPDGQEGVCGSCGRTLPPPDLEAVAASIDQTLSLETGKMVPRTAWAGKAPDGAVDALFSFLPGVKARRQLWERGQQLWTEQISAAMSGPCDDCRAADSDGAPGATLIQMPGPLAAEADTRPRRGGPAQAPATEPLPHDAATVMFPSGSAAGRAPSDAQEAGTTAMPAFREAASFREASPPPEEPPTSAVESFGSSFGAAPPPATSTPAPVDEYESHTVMLSPMPTVRTTTRLVVLGGPVHGRLFTLRPPSSTIGRSMGCQVTVDADGVAYDHARIVSDGSGWTIEPIEPGAALSVNDEPVVAARALRNGDVIQVGPARLRFESAS